MFLIEMIKSIVFGIIEGITEWLPISSTGHLILVQEFIHYQKPNDAFMEMFNVVIQLGAILAVVVLYFDKLNPFKPGKTPRQIQKTWQLWAKVVIASLPAVVIGIPLDNWFEAHFHNFVSVAVMLIIYGLVFILLERRNQGMKPVVTDLEKLPYKTALYWFFPSALPFSWNESLRSNDCRWPFKWHESFRCDRIYLFLGNSSYVWS